MDEAGEEEIIWKKIWSSKIHDRLKIFLWRALVGVLPSRAVLATRIDIRDICCPLCTNEEETVDHLFTKCAWSHRFAFASKWNLGLEAWEGKSLKEVVLEMLSSREFELGVNLGLILSCLFYSIWLARNRIIFDRLQPLEVLVRKFEEVVEEYGEVNRRVREALCDKHSGGWETPLSGWVLVNFDASVKGIRGRLCGWPEMNLAKLPDWRLNDWQPGQLRKPSYKL